MVHIIYDCNSYRINYIIGQLLLQFQCDLHTIQGFVNYIFPWFLSHGLSYLNHLFLGFESEFNQQNRRVLLVKWFLLVIVGTKPPVCLFVHPSICQRVSSSNFMLQTKNLNIHFIIYHLF